MTLIVIYTKGTLMPPASSLSHALLSERSKVPICGKYWVTWPPHIRVESSRLLQKRALRASCLCAISVSPNPTPLPPKAPLFEKHPVFYSWLLNASAHWKLFFNFPKHWPNKRKCSDWYCCGEGKQLVPGLSPVWHIGWENWTLDCLR